MEEKKLNYEKIKYAFNLMVDEIETLRDRVKLLEDTISQINYKLNDIHDGTKVILTDVQSIGKNISGSTKVSSTEEEEVLIKKDRVLIQSLLERAKDEFHVKFLSNILANRYDTLTPKQNSVLTNIQNSL